MSTPAVFLDVESLRERFCSAPSVLHAIKPLLHPTDAFAVAVVASEAHLAAAAAGEVKLYVDDVQVTDRLAELLPRTSDSDAAGYERRLRRDAGATSFTLYVSAAQAYSPALFDAGRRVLAALGRDATREWAEFELFVGRYGVTPAGIHVEDCSNLHFVIDGDKTMHIWPPDHWVPGSADGETVDRAASSGHREYYLRHIDPAPHVADARSLRGRGGDVLCWSAGHWHVGQADGLTIAVNLAVYPSSDDAKSEAVQMTPDGQVDVWAQCEEDRRRVLHDALRRISRGGLNVAPEVRRGGVLDVARPVRCSGAGIAPWTEVEPGRVVFAVDGIVHEAVGVAGLSDLLRRVNAGGDVEVVPELRDAACALRQAGALVQ